MSKDNTNSEDDYKSTISEIGDYTSDIASSKNIEAKECNISTVTVFNDRAEITRNIKLSLTKGNHSLVVAGLSQYVERDSIRISGGKGKATILEVSVEAKQLTQAEITASIQKEMKEKEKLDDERTKLNERMERIKKESQWLESWSKAALGQNNTNSKSQIPPSDFMSPESLEKTAHFLDFYQERLAKIDDLKFKLTKELKELNEKIALIDSEINKKRYPGKERLEVTVTLQVAESGEVQLQVSYVVLNAVWQPSYDCRVSSSDNTLQLMYYGVISNSTGEDWNNVQISLSTAKPSVGGAPTALNTAKIIFKEFAPPVTYSSHSGYPPSTSAPWGGHNQFFQQQNALLDIVQDAPSGGEAFAPPPQMEVLTATATEGGSSTTFNIPRAATIQSDGKPHKVTIAVVSDLKARFTYTAIPCKSTNVYLKATVVNSTTNYPFLAGKIQVFMDNNFVTTSSIKNVFPQEEFALYLGTDAGIKVVYKPPKKLTEVHGMMKKTNFQTVQCMTVIKNTKNIEVGVAVYDQLPLSNDDKIKVKLIEPVLKEKDPLLLLNSFNNIEWRVKIAPGGKVEIPFSYSLEWPYDKEVQVVDC